MSDTTWYIARFTAQKMGLAARRLTDLGYKVWIPTDRFKIWVRNKPTLKDRPVFDRYIFVAGEQPWTIPYAEGVECLILDADGNPAEIPDQLLERFRPRLGEKPKVKIHLKGDWVRVIGGPLEGLKLRVHVHKVNQRSVTLDGPNGAVRLSDGLVEKV